MEGWSAAVRETVSPSQLMPSEIQRMWISSMPFLDSVLSPSVVCAVMSSASAAGGVGVGREHCGGCGTGRCPRLVRCVGGLERFEFVGPEVVEAAVPAVEFGRGVVVEGDGQVGAAVHVPEH